MEVSVVKKDGLYYLKDKNGNLWGGYDYIGPIRKTSKGDKGVTVGIGTKYHFAIVKKGGEGFFVCLY